MTIEKNENLHSPYNRLVECPFCHKNLTKDVKSVGGSRVAHLQECPERPSGRPGP